MWKTTSTNVESQIRNINFATLPKNFKDAIQFTRSLGVEYIWIDSICIIQDPIDWKVESLKMAQYYQNSLCTLSITHEATKSHLEPRNKKPFKDLVRLPYRNRQGDWMGYMYITRDTPVATEFEVLERRSELLPRGWVFQEWLLSTRIIYFARRQFFFECQHWRPCNEKGSIAPPRYGQPSDPYVEVENDQLALNKDAPESRSSYLLNAFARLFQSRYGNAELKAYKNSGFKTYLAQQIKENALSFWYGAVTNYSDLDLTQASDRITALAGIASETRDALQYQDERLGLHKSLDYMAGLWLRDINYGLCWEICQCNESASSPQVANIPSWSWASVMHEVTWPRRYPNMTPCLSLKQVICYGSEKGEQIRMFDARELGMGTTPSLGIDITHCSLVIQAKAIPVKVHPVLSDETLNDVIAATHAFACDERLWEVKELKWNGMSAELRRFVLDVPKKRISRAKSPKTARTIRYTQCTSPQRMSERALHMGISASVILYILCYTANLLVLESSVGSELDVSSPKRLYRNLRRWKSMSSS
jgi:hypothetical protein